VTAQIHAGGRGPAGGVKIVHSLEDVKTVAGLMLGATLTTVQTGPQGQTVKRVYIEQRCQFVRGFYLALLIDTTLGQLTFLASPERGSESIEEIATRHPERVLRKTVDIDAGLSDQQARELAAAVDLSGAHAQTFIRYLHALHEAFIHLDASLIEISPLVVTDNGEVMALDAKMTFDDNALFRHPTVQALRTRASANPTELAAAQQGLNYVGLDGNIGTLVSGAGLAMATLDAIKECGGEPANFLDVPPVARQAQVAGAVNLLLADARLDSALINVFGGGIMRCDVFANGIIAATRESGVKIPLVVRLDGTNVDIGKKALRDAGLDIIFADDLASAAQMVVEKAHKKTTRSTMPKQSSLLGSMKKKFFPS
jgi:succinyl-CoA synthetase beta subunit